MAPKEKARELVESIWHLDEECELYEGFEFGKKCALICVSEIRRTVAGKCDEYWTEVEIEIKLL